MYVLCEKGGDFVEKEEKKEGVCKAYCQSPQSMQCYDKNCSLRS